MIFTVVSDVDSIAYSILQNADWIQRKRTLYTSYLFTDTGFSCISYNTCTKIHVWVWSHIWSTCPYQQQIKALDFL